MPGFSRAMGDGDAEMVGLVVQLVSLTQDLVEAKLRLEAVKKHVCLDGCENSCCSGEQGWLVGARGGEKVDRVEVREQASAPQHRGRKRGGFESLIFQLGGFCWTRTKFHFPTCRWKRSGGW